MSSHHEPHEPWIDRWWPLLLIAFGLIFTLCLTLYRPQHEWSSVRPSRSAHPAVFQVQQDQPSSMV